MSTQPASLGGRLLLLLALAGVGVSAVSAVEASSTQRFELSGSGTLTLDAPLQQTGSLRLKAALVPNRVAVERPKLSAGSFALTATLAASSLVCYNDTIFRNDFDGDGF
jgi:hypothetical protein